MAVSGQGQPAARTYRHLGAFSPLVDLAAARHGLFPDVSPGPDLVAGIRAALGVLDLDAPRAVVTERRWRDGDLLGEEVSWSVGFGPRTRALVLRPAEATGPLPGVLALHCHAGAKSVSYTHLYGGRAVANELARRGAVVLCHDVFCWGSRRFPLADMPDRVVGYADDQRRLAELAGRPLDEVAHYDIAARFHEHVVAKYCGLLGTSFAGVVAAEDLAAARYLRARPDVAADRVGALGLSGGGARAALLGALDPGVTATAVIAMVSGYADLLDAHVDAHTWLLYPPGLTTRCDWPDVVAARAPAPLLVVYAEHDELFPLAGMRRAHRRISHHYRALAAPEHYTGAFVPTGHCFAVDTQELAFAWLDRHLGLTAR